MILCRLPLFAVAVLGLHSVARAGPFRTRSIILTGTPPQNLISFDDYVSSEAGVCFVARTQLVPAVRGLFLWSNGVLTQLDTTGSNPGAFAGFNGIAINDTGQIAITAVRVGESHNSVYLRVNGAWQQLFNGQSLNSDPGPPSINNAGDLAIRVTNPKRILKWHNGQFLQLVTLGSTYTDLSERVVLSDSGLVFFGASLPGGAPTQAFRVAENGSATPLLMLNQLTQFFDANDINDFVTVGFTTAIRRVRSDLGIETVADASNGFTNLFGVLPRTNSRRDVAFRGFTPAEGVFLWRAHAITEVVAHGDVLDGHAFDSVFYAQVDRRGRVFFRGYFPDVDQEGIFYATPKGDFDGDGDVDLLDYDHFAQCYSGSLNDPGYVPPSAECSAVYDFDEDGDVDLSDYEALQDALHGTCATNPHIVTHPVNQSANPGDAVTFSVVAEGQTPLTYQWKHFGIDIPGATAPSLSLSGVTVADAGVYVVSVFDGCFPVETSATLTVGGGQTFAWQLANGVWSNSGAWIPTGIPSVAADIATINNNGICHVNGNFQIAACEAQRGTLTFNGLFNRLTFNQMNVGATGQPFAITSTVGGELAGNIDVGADGQISVTGGQLKHISGTLTLQPDGAVSASGASATFNGSTGGTKLLRTGVHAAHIDVAGGAHVTLKGPCESDGPISVTNGLLELSSGNIALGKDAAAEICAQGPSAQIASSMLVQMGLNATGSGTLHLSGGATFTGSEDTLQVGLAGAGSVIVEGAGSILSARDMFVSTSPLNEPSGTGAMTAQNGGLVMVNSGGTLVVGDDGAGSLTITGAGSSFGGQTGNIHVGRSAIGAGQIQVASGATFSCAGGAVTVGESGSGSFSVSGTGATATLGVLGSERLHLGKLSGSVGNLSVTNGAVLTHTSDGQDLRVGGTGTGHLLIGGGGSTMTSGAIITLKQGDIAVSNGGQLNANGTLSIDAGSMTVAGVGSELHCTGDALSVTGGLEVQSSAQITGTAILVCFGTIGVTGSTLHLQNFANNFGTISVTDGSFELSGTLMNNGTVTYDAAEIHVGALGLGADGRLVESGASGGHFLLIGSFTNTSDEIASWNTTVTEFEFDGGNGALQTLEVASSDLGAVPAGYVQNFAMGTLHVGPSTTTLRLMDVANNAPGAEAAYVTNLVLDAGTTLDLNGRTLYYMNLTNGGADIVLNGGQLVPVIP